MIIDDSIILKYLRGKSPDEYKNCWIYHSVGRGNIFTDPSPQDREWVGKLYIKLKEQIANYVPRNIALVHSIFPDFDTVVNNYTVMLVVGFPDPYDAMVLEHDGKEVMVFDLIQFTKVALDPDYSCHRVLTHELLHMCIHNKYPKPGKLSYIDELNYIAFDEGFAHAVSYPEDINHFQLDSFLSEKSAVSRIKMREALAERDPIKQTEYLASTDTGDYWNKFASICGKLYLLEHINEMRDIYRKGWHDFGRVITG